jgi:Domain of unknown function (DUF4169)
MPIKTFFMRRSPGMSRGTYNALQRLRGGDFGLLYRRIELQASYAIASAGRRRKGLVTMGDIVNLSKYRKQRQRTEHAKQAAENRVRFGQNKADRTRTRNEQDRLRQDLDGKRRDDGRPDENN